VTALRDLLASAAQNAAAGRVDDALANYRGALKRSPALAEVHYNVGVLLARKGELAGAEKSFDEALRLKPSWAQAYLALGHLYFRQARYADAERSCGRAATHSPESVEALFNLATSRDRQRRWGDALPPLQAARSLAPDNEDIWFALRGHLLLFQREEEAFDDFRRFETNAALSARIVAAGLLSARIAPGMKPVLAAGSIGLTSRVRGRTRPSRSRRRSISTLRVTRCCASTRRTIASARPSAGRSPISPRRARQMDGGFALATCRPISART
jgi:tetratricopeptide (TPR) repeat protein